MKLYLSNLGIQESIKYDIKDIVSNLNSARFRVSSCPSSFKYASFVQNLPTKLSGYVRRLNRLEDTARYTDRRYQEILMDSKRKIESISDPNIKERLGFKKTSFDIQTKGTSDSLSSTYLRASDVVKTMEVKPEVDPNGGRGKYQSMIDFSTDLPNLNVNVVDPNKGRGKYQDMVDFSTELPDLNVNVVDPNGGRGKYQTTDFSTQKPDIDVKVVDPNEGRGKYQSMVDFSTEKPTINARVVDPNEGRGKYQEMIDFSTQKPTINAKVVDPNEGRGKYQDK